MKYFADCFTCYMNQIHKALRLLDPDIEERRIVDAQKKMMEFIAKTDLDKTNNITFGTEVYNIVAQTLGVKDPYQELKKKYNQLALNLYPKIKQMVTKSKSPLSTAIKMSIMGNSIDFGASNSIDINKEMTEIEENAKNGKLNIEELIQSIEKSKTILILGDNTGEIVFDKIMIEQITNDYPDKKIYYSVRSGPIINDSTIEDAEYIGLDKICTVLETSASPGIILEQSKPEFISVFNRADLIISKGQGNFESIIDINTGNKDVYLLLKAKCMLMTYIFDLPLGSLILQKKNESLILKCAQLKLS